MESKVRFIALDSFRGLLACLLVLFHVHAHQDSRIHIFTQKINCPLLINFFFVLSGFVIANTYQKKLTEGFGIARFMLLRFGRFYPLHFVMLILFILMEASRFFLPMPAFGNAPPFTGEGRTIHAIITNLLLVHGIGLERFTTWNWTSWTISSEFFTYLLFPISLYCFKRIYSFFLIAFLMIAPIIMNFITNVYDLSYVQRAFMHCIYGFSAGAFIFQIRPYFSKMESFLKSHFALATLIELSVITIVFAIVIQLNNPVFAIIIFALLILVFTFQAGALNQFLQMKPFIIIGKLTYSIYLLHVFIIIVFQHGTHLIQKMSGIALVNSLPKQGYSLVLLGANPLQGDIACILILLTTIGLARLTYIYIETPGNNYFRNLVGYVPNKKKEV